MIVLPLDNEIVVITLSNIRFRNEPKEALCLYRISYQNPPKNRITKEGLENLLRKIPNVIASMRHSTFAVLDILDQDIEQIKQGLINVLLNNDEFQITWQLRTKTFMEFRKSGNLMVITYRTNNTAETIAGSLMANPADIAEKIEIAFANRKSVVSQTSSVNTNETTVQINEKLLQIANTIIAQNNKIIELLEQITKLLQDNKHNNVSQEEQQLLDIVSDEQPSSQNILDNLPDIDVTDLIG